MNDHSVKQVRFASNGVSPAVLWLLLATIALLLSPPSSHAAKTVKVKAAITAAEDLNPDYQGRPSPVNIIVFQLVSADAFSNADFFSLFEPEATVLGGDMLARTQMMLKPGESMEWVAEFSKETRFVGVVAVAIAFDVVDDRSALTGHHIDRRVDRFVLIGLHEQTPASCR